MAKVRVMPVIGAMTNSRLESLRGCHALTERSVVREFTQTSFNTVVGQALKELLLADRHAALEGKLTFIVQVEM